MLGADRNLVIVLCLGVWLHAADNLLVSTLIPDIVREIGGASLISWTYILYEIGSIMTGAAGAVLIIILGLRNAMMAAALLYAFGCGISATAGDMVWMLVGRLIQGVGGGGLMTLSIIGVTRIFDNVVVPRVLAIVGVVWGVSAVSGPLIGGYFATLGIWRGGFWFFAIQALLLTCGIFVLFKDKDHQDKGHNASLFPIWRLIVLATSILLVALAGLDVVFLRSAILSVLGMAVFSYFFILDNKSGESRMFLRQAWKVYHPANAALLLSFAFAASSISFYLFGPIFLQEIHGASPITAGYAIAMGAIGWTTAGIVVGGVKAQHDPWMIRLGSIAILLSTIGFIYFIISGPLWLIFCISLLEGFGFGVCWVFVLRQASVHTHPAERDRLAASFTTMQRIGYAFGASVMGIVANYSGFSTGVNLESSKAVALSVFAVSIPFAVVGVLAAFRLSVAVKINSD